MSLPNIVVIKYVVTKYVILITGPKKVTIGSLISIFWSLTSVGQYLYDDLDYPIKRSGRTEKLKYLRPIVTSR